MTESVPTLCLSFDFDAVCIWMAAGAHDARSLSRGEFGARVGAPRILDLCDRLEITASWFVPGHTAETFPEITREIADRGHEIANHGYLHEDFSRLSTDEARSVLERSSDALERLTGRRPRGIRFPPWAVDASIFELLLEQGFTYDSSLMDDCRAHWCRRPDTLADDGPNIFGAELPLVQLPVSFITSDFAYFEFNGFGSPTLPAGLRNPRDVEAIWLDEMEYSASRAPGSYVMLMLHPQSIGWGSRMLMLERVLEHWLARPGARIVSAETIADEFRRSASGIRGN